MGFRHLLGLGFICTFTSDVAWKAHLLSLAGRLLCIDCLASFMGSFLD